MSATSVVVGERESGQSLPRFRPDIQAIRAIAVLLVVVYHLWPTRLAGGFIGVDVFFVVSGYLIVGHLLREAELSGRLDLRRFWLRRARRLLPAALTVLAVTTAAIYLWIPQNLWMQYLREVVASVFYVQNWVLAADAVDYLAQHNTASPVQHFWTLSVEEQFYIVTPLLMAGLLVAARRGRWNARRTLLIGIATVSLASFVTSLILTAINPPAAYFATTTRAWEFGLGALLAFAPMLRRPLWATVAFFGGAFVVILAGLFLNSTVPFPSATALWPVVGTLLMIAGGGALGNRVRSWIALPPVQFVGNVSYSAYLWHWPLIVMLPWIVGHELGLGERVGILASTFALAWLSTRFIENPVRFSRRVFTDRRPVVTAVASVAAMSLVAALAGAGMVALHLRVAESQAVAEEEQSEPCFGAPAALDPHCADVEHDTITPDPLAAAQDDPNRLDCWAGAEESRLTVCTLGDADSPVRIAAVGDSHNNALISAYERIADERGWRIDVAGHNGCYWTRAVQVKPVLAQETACEAWKEELRDYLAEAGDAYDAILVTSQRETTRPAGEDWQEREVDGLVEEWSQSPAPVLVLRDVPRMRDDIITCITQNLSDPNAACSRAQQEALGDREAQLIAAQIVGLPVIDLTDVFCRRDVCVPVIGGVLAYRDPDHLTGTFAESLAPILADRLAPLLGEH